VTDDDDLDPDAVFEVKLTDELDLHAFSPRDAKSLVSDWLDDCAAARFQHVRIVHGKGVGTLREIVHAVLRSHPAVEDFGLDSGNWGATVVRLRTPPA
jgi:dsDNA-specific endonuclease/ATPase MutS2